VPIAEIRLVPIQDLRSLSVVMLQIPLAGFFTELIIAFSTFCSLTGYNLRAVWESGGISMLSKYNGSRR